MDPNVRALVGSVRELVTRVDGLLAHFSAIDADYGRLKDVALNHERRLARLEHGHNLDPIEHTPSGSALIPKDLLTPPSGQYPVQPT